MLSSIHECHHGDINGGELSYGEIYKVERKLVDFVSEIIVVKGTREKLLKRASKLAENNLDMLDIALLFLQELTVMRGIMAPLIAAQAMPIAKMTKSVFVAYRNSIKYATLTEGRESS